MFVLEANEVATIADENFRFEWQLAEQLSTKLCSRSRLPNDKGPCSTHVHDLIFAQFSCEDAWPQPSVSANIDASEENDESHSGDYREVA